MEQKDLIILALIICASYLLAGLCLAMLLAKASAQKPVAEKKDTSKLPSQVTHEELTANFNKIRDAHGYDAAFKYLEKFGELQSREIELRLRGKI